MQSIRVIVRVIKKIIVISPIFALYTLISAVLSVIIPIMQTLLIAQILDCLGSIGIENDKSRLLFYLCIFAATFLVRGVLDICESYINRIELSNRIKTKFSFQLAEKVFRLDMIMFEDADIYNHIKRARKCLEDDKLSEVFKTICVIAPAFFSIIGLIISVSNYNIILVFMALVSIIPSFIVTISANSEYYKLMNFQTENIRKRDYYWWLLCKKQSSREMKIMNFQNYVFTKWGKVLEESLIEENRVKGRASWRIFWGDFIKILFYTVSIALSVVLVARKNITIGEFGSCIACFASLQMMAQYIVTGLASLGDDVSYITDFFYVYDMRPTETTGNETLQMINEIEMNNVKFSYPASKKIVLDIGNVKISKGEKIAIVGENGSGKTTLIKLLTGAYKPQEGDVLINGETLGKFSPDSVNGLVSIVQQDFLRIIGTIADNIDLRGCKEISTLVNNVHEVGGDKDILKIGLEQELGVEFGGRELSGGQWQKIALARGLCKECQLLILDEPTASLDPVMENEILMNYVEMAKKNTTIIATHRLGICRYVDKIIVMKQGRICECGTHKDLLNSLGEYAKMWKIQSKWYMEENG